VAIEDILTEAARRIAADPEQLRAVNAVFKLILTGEGGGTWLLRLKDSPELVKDDGDADCCLELSVQDCMDLLEGRVSTQQLFFRGQLEITGDMGHAVKLPRVIELLR
jgi:putative sterol carrier protein